MVYEARVRCCAKCVVNNREEQVWSIYSPMALCKWVEMDPPPEAALDDDEEVEKEVNYEGHKVDYSWILSVFLFIVVAVLSFVLALIVGRMAV